VSGIFGKVSFFEEKSADARFDGDGRDGKDETLKAHELFSIFTDDIIKHEVVFIRRRSFTFGGTHSLLAILILSYLLSFHP
jgi:hypothetical protein